MKDIGVMAAVMLMAMVSAASASSVDTFGTDGNQFTIDFVTISGATNPTSGIPAGSGFDFTGVNNDYRMGICEVTYDQWNKFTTSLGVPVTGHPYYGYDTDPYYTGSNAPATGVSWYEAAQFVNWLNTSTGHPAAYNFTGTQGTSDYTFATWSAAEADNGTNLYRHKDAFYYLPTENEWVKAAYWNGTTLQAYATKPGDTLHQGDGTSGTGWNYYDNGDAYDTDSPWDVGSGSEELNGTFDMMGNVWDWVESPYSVTSYEVASDRVRRGGTWATDSYVTGLPSTARYDSSSPTYVTFGLGFRVASESPAAVVPEPLTIMSALIGLGMIGGYARKRRATC